MIELPETQPEDPWHPNQTHEPPIEQSKSHRNDTISPVIVVIFIIFLFLQSTYSGSLTHLFSNKSHGITRVTSSESSAGVPSSVAQGIIQIDLEAKSSYLASSLPKAALPAPVTVQTLSKQTLKSRQTALRDATKLFAKYPDQPALATRVILLRAETGDPNPLAPVYLSKGKPAHLPLDAYNVYATLPVAQRAPYERTRGIWKQLFTSSTVDPALAASLAAQIRAVPNLRWWIGIALHQLYVRDGDTRKAGIAISAAGKEAGISVGVSSLITVVAGMIALIGIIALLLLIISKALDINIHLAILNPSPPLIHDDERRLGAGDLMNVFTLYLILMLSVGLIAPMLLKNVLHHAASSGSAASTTVIIAAEAVLTLFCGTVTVLVLVALARHRGASLSREIGLNLGPRSLLYTLAFGLLGWGIALPVLVGVAKVSDLLFHNAPSPANPAIPLLMTAPAGWASLVLYILVAVLAPFFEETLFRGMFYNAARLRVGVPGGILLTGAAFGLAHPVGIAEQIPLMALGGVFAWMAETRKSLLPSMFAHCLQNSFVYATLFFSLLTITPK